MEGGDDVRCGSGCGGRSMVGLGKVAISIAAPVISSLSSEVDWLILGSCSRWFKPTHQG